MNNPLSSLTVPMAKLAPDASDAAWRVAGTQLIKLTREPLVAALSRSLGPGDEALKLKIAAFLETELGAAVLSAVLSIGLSTLPAIPVPGGTQAVSRLAKELRVRAMADAADVTADLVMGPLRESLAMLIAPSAMDVAFATLDASNSPAPAIAPRQSVAV